MVKVVVVNKNDLIKAGGNTKGKINVDHNKELVAIHKVISSRYSDAYKKTIAANVPVTYVSGKNVVKREVNGKRTIIKKISPSISVPAKYIVVGETPHVSTHVYKSFLTGVHSVKDESIK